MSETRLAARIVLLLLSTLAGPGASADDPLPHARDTAPQWMHERDDPRTDGWDSEVFSNAVSTELGKLARALETGGEIAEFAHPEFSALAPLPAELEAVYTRAPVRVFRGSTRNSASATRERGAQGWATVVGAIFEPLRAGEGRHVKFKVIEVPPQPSSLRGARDVRVLLEADGRTTGKHTQVTATMLWSWLPDAAATRPLVASLFVESYEAVEYDSPTEMFSDCTASALGDDRAFAGQLRFGNEYWMRRLQSVLGIDNYGHHGLAVGDIDGDGLEDLYVCQTGGMPNLLYLQNPDGTVREAARAYGVDFMDRTHAALLIDLDNDGDQDLVLATQPALLFLANDGKGAFTIGARRELPSAYSLAAADYDGDGDVDIYATAYVAPVEWERDGGLGLQPLPYYDANNGAANALFRNDGAFRFTIVTADVGLDVNNRRWSFAASWADYDDDGDADLYVANDFGRNNLYRNDGGRFVDVAADAGVEDTASGMSVAWGDFDGDGLLDLHVGNMFSSAGNRIVPQQGFQADAGDAVKTSFRRFARGNTLYHNNGNGTFRDVSVAMGVTMGRWAWSAPFVDLDNDGWQDLVVANGYISNENSGDL